MMDPRLQEMLAQIYAPAPMIPVVDPRLAAQQPPPPSLMPMSQAPQFGVAGMAPPTAAPAPLPAAPFAPVGQVPARASGPLTLDTRMREVGLRGQQQQQRMPTPQEQAVRANLPRFAQRLDMLQRIRTRKGL
jgi:hypothetical protein